MNKTLQTIFDTEYEYLRHNSIDNTITVLSNEIESHDQNLHNEVNALRTDKNSETICGDMMFLENSSGEVYDESEITRDINDTSSAQLLPIEEDTAVFPVDNQIQNINEPQEINSSYTTSERNIDPPFACTQGAHTAVAFSHVEPTIHESVFNPDQVWHDFLFFQPSSQVGSHVVSENTILERSEPSETAAFSQEDTSAVANHSGLQGLDPSVDLVASIIDSVQEILDTDASTPQEWYTPPQTPPSSSSHVNAFDSQVHPPSNSLYVYGSIADRSTLMLVDTGASVTAVSSNFVSTFTVSPKLEPSPISSIQTVSGEHLPVLGQVNLPLTIGANAYPFETLVIDNLTYPVVLGRNFLMHLVL